MIKSIFIGLKQDENGIKHLLSVKPNHIITTSSSMDKNYWLKLKKLKIDLSISFTAFENGICPANPKAKELLYQKLDQLLTFKPQQLWLDHFRFDGHWENARNEKITGIHRECKSCKGINRSEFLQKLAQDLIKQFGKRTQIGYFAVPLKLDEFPSLLKLGQNHKVLGKIFDLSSPMLYHRMLGKPVSYISEYTSYIYSQTKKPVLPIIQIKDMPDNLSDDLSEKEFKEAFFEAKKPPSMGISIFLWEHAVEKNKVGIIRELFSRPLVF